MDFRHHGSAPSLPPPSHSSSAGFNERGADSVTVSIRQLPASDGGVAVELFQRPHSFRGLSPSPTAVPPPHPLPPPPSPPSFRGRRHAARKPPPPPSADPPST